MKDTTIKDKFYDQLQRAIDVTEKKANTYAAVFYAIRIALILLAGAITILSAYREWNPGMAPMQAATAASSAMATLGTTATPGATAQSSWLASLNWILVLGAITTALTAIDTLFQTEAKKGAYKLALFELRSLRSEYVFEHQRTDGKVDMEFTKELFEKYKKANSYGLNLDGADSEGGGAA